MLPRVGEGITHWIIDSRERGSTKEHARGRPSHKTCVPVSRERHTGALLLNCEKECGESSPTTPNVLGELDRYLLPDQMRFVEAEAVCQDLHARAKHDKCSAYKVVALELLLQVQHALSKHPAVEMK
jgi:hypothetical protein